MRDQDAWLCFADEAGQVLRPPKAGTWSRRGRTPRIAARAAGSGRISLAGLVCRRPGHRTRLVFRMLVHHSHKGERLRHRPMSGVQHGDPRRSLGMTTQTAASTGIAQIASDIQRG
ncbi:hypothetical protein AQI88_41260 [Streptomyces cellostaticus]|uniref:Transposase n=1 Tax=Streptomyces cellostaticus TaxID=67285 RepID=A0A101N4L3_9ACTN|nr:hypothetical protein [Streptomyces cellostaticus]KUM86447.1 hypothetical protein AQI88_41260 [Streptomyces cellostaticus]